MAPFYESLCKEFGWTVDTALLSNMRYAVGAFLKYARQIHPVKVSNSFDVLSMCIVLVR